MSMKKLMIAACGVLVVTLSTRAEEPKNGIMSADVVGYASNNLRWGSIGLVPQFAGVASADGSFDLQTITCSDNSSDSVSFSVLDNTGLNGDSYFWIDYYENPETGETESCWVDGAFEKVSGYTLNPGEALWVYADSTDQLFQSAGRVNTSDVAVQLRQGSTLTGNPFPVTLDLQDITCSDNSSDSVSFSILDNTGLNGDSYFWIDYYENPKTGETESCWVDGEFEKVNGFKVTPGMGLWVYADSSDQYITFPGVELN